MSKLLVFDIWGNYAHFRKPYTTTSPLTYSIPSRTALTGIIGAILGIEKEKNNEELNYSNCNLSLRILNPIKKVIINQNLIDTKTSKMMARIKPKGGRTQIRFEKLKDVKYRIYVEIFDTDLYERLKETLKEHTPKYTPCFGISEDIANFQFVGEFDYEVEHGSVEIDSVVNMEELVPQNIEFEEGKEYFADTYPLEMKRNREVLKYGEILIERQGKSILVKDTDYLSLSTKEKIKWV
jgi:CRISPR-associated protein Cas5h